MIKFFFVTRAVILFLCCLVDSGKSRLRRSSKKQQIVCLWNIYRLVLSLCSFGIFSLFFKRRPGDNISISVQCCYYQPHRDIDSKHDLRFILLIKHCRSTQAILKILIPAFFGSWKWKLTSNKWNWFIFIQGKDYNLAKPSYKKSIKARHYHEINMTSVVTTFPWLGIFLHVRIYNIPEVMKWKEKFCYKNIQQWNWYSCSKRRVILGTDKFFLDNLCWIRTWYYKLRFNHHLITVG